MSGRTAGRKRTTTRGSASRETPAGPARRRRPRLGLVLLACVLAEVGVWTAVKHASRPRAHRAVEVEDSTQQLDGAAALSRAVELDGQGRHRESLPYFRRAAAAGSGWLVHWDYAAALNNAAMAARDPNGSSSAAARSTVERVELARTALDEVVLAEQQAPNAHSLAMLKVVRGQTLEWWGFTREALEEYRAALVAEPGAPRALSAQAGCLKLLRLGHKDAR